MKRKKTIRIVLLSGGLLLGLLFALQFTPVGYIVACMFGMEYYSEWAVVPGRLEKEGDLPPSFHLRLVTAPSQYGTVIPLLLTYRLDRRVCMFVDFHVSGNSSSDQYLDLTRLDLVRSDGMSENLLPRITPVELHHSTNEYVGVSKYYRAGRLEHAVAEQGGVVQVHFTSSLWPAAGKVTLISEGTTHGDGIQNDPPFRQVSDWTIVRRKGIRKPWIP